MPWVLQTQSLRLPDESGAVMPDVSLRPGDVAWFDGTGFDRGPVAGWFDVLTGLRPPASGRVAVTNQAWEQRASWEQDAVRGTLRRLDAGSRWISNLDIVENIILAERHHTRRPESAIMDEAETLARVVGLPTLPAGRPADATAEVLRQCVWVRLLLGTPVLLLVDERAADPSRETAEALGRIVAAKREQGTAVLWVGSQRIAGLR